MKLAAIARQMAATGQSEQVAHRALQSRKLAQELDRARRASVLRHVTRHPVDVTDAQAFPEIAEAIAHYRANRARIDAEMENDK